MVQDSELRSLSREQRDALAERRIRLRNFYCSDTGKDELIALIVGSKALSKLDEGENCELGAHNLVIDILDSIGLLDEGFLRLTLTNLLLSPLIPSSAEPIGDMENAE